MLMTTIDGISVFVNGCIDCPFYQHDIVGGECKYPTKRKPKAFFEKKFDEYYYFNGYPEDCPMRIGVKDEDKVFVAKDEITGRKRAVPPYPEAGFVFAVNYYKCVPLMPRGDLDGA